MAHGRKTRGHECLHAMSKSGKCQVCVDNKRVECRDFRGKAFKVSETSTKKHAKCQNFVDKRVRYFVGVDFDIFWRVFLALWTVHTRVFLSVFLRVLA